ncbi:hypothetical protein HYY69_06300 [Candidatus Woesearchaeota archaeon]|nr:hypothetical protein [Candidatus Woesearchaeota archaeon]
MENIQFIGTDELDVEEMMVLNRLAKKYHERAERLINDEAGMTVHIKSLKKNSPTKKYSVTCKIMAPSQIFRAAGTGWKLNDCLHKAGLKIEHEIEHKLKRYEEKKHTVAKKNLRVKKRD